VQPSPAQYRTAKYIPESIRLHGQHDGSNIVHPVVVIIPLLLGKKRRRKTQELACKSRVLTRLARHGAGGPSR